MNALKARLLAGEYVTAAWAELGNADIAEILVRHGWDVIVIDGEHGTGDLEDWIAVARAVEAAGGTPLLRVPDGSDTTLKKALDRGFRSIIVPMVNSAEQAQAIARSCLYPPRGARGYAAPILRCSDWGSRAGYARDESHEELLLFVQCEHPDSVADLARIAAVPGIDGIFLGPNDLASMMGHLERMDAADPQAAFAKVEAAGAEAGTILATVTGGGRGWADLKARGFRLVVGPNDVSLLVAGACGALSDRDADLGDNAPMKAVPQKY